MAREPRQIAKAIADRDAKQLQQLPEIGKKLSETIVLELREKVDSYVEGVSKPGGSVEGKPATGVGGEAVAALIALGESPADAERRVGIIMERHPELTSTDAIVSAAFAASG